jgi:hypothetical protein
MWECHKNVKTHMNENMKMVVEQMISSRPGIKFGCYRGSLFACREMKFALRSRGDMKPMMGKWITKFCSRLSSGRIRVVCQSTVYLT